MRAQRGVVAGVMGMGMAALVLAGCSTQESTSGDGSAGASTPASSSPAAASSPVAGSTPSTVAFTSSKYGYSAGIPATWAVSPALTAWDGGDIGHDQDYADRFTDPEGNTYFILGIPTDLPADEFASEHLAWLSANRGCPAPSMETEVSVDGASGVRAAIHCPDGVLGPTLVSKAIVVDDGAGLIVTSFSPDTGPDAFAPLDTLMASMRWTSQP